MESRLLATSIPAIFLFISSFLTLCSSSPVAEQTEPRKLVLSGVEVEETFRDPESPVPTWMLSWECRDSSGKGKVLIEFGLFMLYLKPVEFKGEIADVLEGLPEEYRKYIDGTELEGSGFVLYDGTDTGDYANHKRVGINHRWNWGLKDDSYNYAFVIKPDGTGLYYDFSGGRTEVKASQVYKCSRN